jgi:dephospho-CoA kinase
VLKVALTGGIATGKSYVLDRIRRSGVPCLDADELAHDVTRAGTEAARAIARRFGDRMLDATGAVDRAALGAIVFADADARRSLEAIVHPVVYRAIGEWLRALERAEDVCLAVVDVPLLYETGRATDFDRVIATVCPRAVQIARLLSRGLTREEAERRLEAQLPADEKAARADFAIATGGTFEETDRQVDELVHQLTLEQPAGRRGPT